MLALLYDVHGNLTALEAVLEDARAAGAERFLLGGDYALFGAFPAETISALRALSDAQWIRGNVDRWAAWPERAPEDPVLHEAISACRAELGPDLAGELGDLPEQLVLDGIRYCHASPRDDMHSFGPEPGDEDERLLAGASEPRVVFGHTHLAFRRPGPGGVELLNPGSVGLPLDGDPRAAYALVGADGSVQIRRVEYDRQPSIEQLSCHGDADWATRSIRRLREARP